MTIILDNYPPSTLQGVGIGAVRIRELLSEKIIVISAPPRFAIAMPIADPEIASDFRRQEKAVLHCESH